MIPESIPTRLEDLIKKLARPNRHTFRKMANPMTQQRNASNSPLLTLHSLRLILPHSFPECRARLITHLDTIGK